MTSSSSFLIIFEYLSQIFGELRQFPTIEIFPRVLLSSLITFGSIYAGDEIVLRDTERTCNHLRSFDENKGNDIELCDILELLRVNTTKYNATLQI